MKRHFSRSNLTLTKIAALPRVKPLNNSQRQQNLPKFRGFAAVLTANHCKTAVFRTFRKSIFAFLKRNFSRSNLTLTKIAALSRIKSLNKSQRQQNLPKFRGFAAVWSAFYCKIAVFCSFLSANFCKIAIFCTFRKSIFAFLKRHFSRSNLTLTKIGEVSRIKSLNNSQKQQNLPKFRGFAAVLTANHCKIAVFRSFLSANFCIFGDFRNFAFSRKFFAHIVV